MKRLVIYHANCIDGFTAAWAAWRGFGDADTTYQAASYGDAPPDVTGRDVLIVDFSYPRDVLVQIAACAESLRVIDHHKTAQEALADLPFAIFDMNRSGAGLTWDLLHGTARPWLIDYVEDRDLWLFRLPDSNAINAWIGAYRRASFADWNWLQIDGLRAARKRGEAVLAYVDQYVREVCAQAIEIEFCGYRVPMVNAPYKGISEVLGRLAEGAPFAVGWSQRADKLFAYSLRSHAPDGLDVSELAKRFGGGGHRHAAGFVVKGLLT